MAARELLPAGNNSIDAEDDFASGFTNGSLYYYDTTHQLPRPSKSEAISCFILGNLHDTHASVHWNVGFVCGWLVALCENNPEYFFTSLPLPASVPVQV